MGSDFFSSIMPLSHGSLINVLADTTLNAFFLQGFIYGLYTLLFVLALWKLYRRGSNKFYILALAALWITLMTNWVMNWMRTCNAFAINNRSPAVIDRGLHTGTQANIPPLLASLIADVILIWRCTILWNRNRWVFYPLALLFVASTAFVIGRSVSHAGGLTDTLSIGISDILSSITTMSATTLITLRIIMVTRRSPIRSSYRQIIEILLESAAIYSIVLLTHGILLIVDFIHPFDIRSPSGVAMWELSMYINFIQPPVTGIAPTLIAFRVAEEKPKSEATGTGPLSRLTFKRSQSNRGHEITSGILSTLRLGRDNRHGSVTISSVHHLQLDIEAQDNAALSNYERENEEKLEKHDGIEAFY
ncbi:hypothetical protein D9619_009241 [Psilocybe cf. subviscida]|uniref:Uncharacterized protein n=1 Tax=Psilocybe cf. subviscida TaxID=2480587 RepID=A0A8H5FA97_9AGAR|nr:hypothetical protein D9619_009241 [Psilocybe cf. subviscida]